MTRHLYRLLLQLHPAEFRYRFAGEMLWIFDMTSQSGSTGLILDGLFSLARQWLLRSNLWMFCAGVAINAAIVMITIFGPLKWR